MGLFDYFKSPEEKKRQELFEKMNKTIFPNGKIQMDREVQEVRELLDFRYPKTSIQETYVYAAAIYYMDDTKSQESVMSSILRNTKTEVTKADALKIYNYLKNKFDSDPKQKALSEIRNLPHSNRLFMIATGGSVELKNAYKPLSEKGKFEVMICNALIALRDYHIRFSDEEYDTAFHELCLLMYQQAPNYGVHMTDAKYVDFLNSRFEFYSNELDEQAQNTQYLQLQVYNTFYVKPLAEPPESNNDLAQYILFLPAYYKMIEWVRKRVSEIK